MDTLINQLETFSLMEEDEYELLLFYYNLEYDDKDIEYYLQQTVFRYKRYLENIVDYLGHHTIKYNMELFIQTFKNNTTLLQSFHIMKNTDRLILIVLN